MANIDPISSDIGVVAKSLLAARGKASVARALAEARKSSPRVMRLLETMTVQKAAVGAGTMSDGNYGEILGDWRMSSAAFFASLRNRSIFFRLLDSGFVRVPMRTPIGVVAASATGWIVGEGQPTPVSKLTLAAGSLQPIKAAALIVVTNDVADSMTDAAGNLVNTELRGAVSDVVDKEFFDIVMAGAPTSVSSGPDIDSIRADLRQMLDVVNTTGAGYLLWAMAPDVANRATFIDDPRAAMTPTGGEFLGLPAYVSSTIPAGTLRLINGASIAANAEDIMLDVSGEADIQMADNPTNNSGTPTAAELVSLFQTNSVAMKAVVTFGVDRARDNAIAELTGIAWGQP